jgi:hypothetical protein
LGTFKNPGLHPIKQPPGNESFGIALEKHVKEKSFLEFSVIPDNHLHLKHELHNQYVFHSRIMVEFSDEF